MSKFNLPITLPEEVKDCLRTAETLITSGCTLVNETCALVSEVRGTNQVLQQVLKQQLLVPAPPITERARRAHRASAHERN